MTGKLRVGVAIAVGAIAVVSVAALLWVNRPFQAELGSYRTSLAERTEAQKHNIRKAVMALDGVVIEPGETFSFNETVGSRTSERGYREARAYLERDLVTSVGGGICQVSSTVYNAAVLSGLDIVERHPHFRCVASVPAGRDATVWYGVADLRIKNTYPSAVRISVLNTDVSLIARVRARTKYYRGIEVRTIPVPVSKTGVLAYKTIRDRECIDRVKSREFLSIDIYQY